MPIGPSLPPHLQPAQPTVSTTYPDEEEEEDDNDFGPALPPHLAAARKAATAGPSRPVAGPSIPSQSNIAGPSIAVSGAGDDDSDDDEVGPKFVPGVEVEKSAVEEFLEREARWAKEREVSSSRFRVHRSLKVVLKHPSQLVISQTTLEASSKLI